MVLQGSLGPKTFKPVINCINYIKNPTVLYVRDLPYSEIPLKGILIRYTLGKPYLKDHGTW